VHARVYHVSRTQSTYGNRSHADRVNLLARIAALPTPPRRIYVTHGEPAAADSLRQAIEERHRWPASVPDYLEIANL